tara:strand:+ start:161 stop:382 length:222 start_codon:yes stop_codon:yes gene_type:complete
MNQYNNYNQDQSAKKMINQDQKAQGGGILNSIYTKMSGHPTCEIEMDYVPGRKYFTAGDDLKGKIRIKTTVEG